MALEACDPGAVGVKFCFENHVLDADRRELSRGGETIAVEPQVFDLLVYLVGNRDRVVSKEDLIASVWGGRIVSGIDAHQPHQRGEKALGDSGGEQRLIRTAARKGVRFVGAVRMQDETAAPAAATEDGGEPRARRCRCPTGRQ
jgi:DNA-binding winged helix-turn-helix (wHTH) protein